MHFIPHTHASSEPLIGLSQLQVGYGGHAVLPPISFQLRPNEFWAIIGRNGSGKSTLLRTLLGLLPKVSGQLSYRAGLRLGYVPQRNELDQSLPARVLDVVLEGVERQWSFLRPFYSRAEKQRVEQAMQETETSALAHQPFAQLSEGQKQRVLLARALVGQPQVLILDEPTSAMDLVAERAVFELIERVRQKHGLAILMVSHHLALVAERATDVLFVDKEDQVATAGCIADIAGSEAFRQRYGTMACGILEDAAGSAAGIAARASHGEHGHHEHGHHEHASNSPA